MICVVEEFIKKQNNVQHKMTKKLNKNVLTYYYYLLHLT